MHFEHFSTLCVRISFRDVAATKTQGERRVREGALRLTTGKDRGWEVKKRRKRRKLTNIKVNYLSFYEANRNSFAVQQISTQIFYAPYTFRLDVASHRECAYPRRVERKLRPALLKCQRLPRKSHRRIPVSQEAAPCESNGIVSARPQDNSLSSARKQTSRKIIFLSVVCLGNINVNPRCIWILDR